MFCTVVLTDGGGGVSKALSVFVVCAHVNEGGSHLSSDPLCAQGSHIVQEDADTRLMNDRSSFTREIIIHPWEGLKTDQVLAPASHSSPGVQDTMMMMMMRLIFTATCSKSLSTTVTSPNSAASTALATNAICGATQNTAYLFVSVSESLKKPNFFKFSIIWWTLWVVSLRLQGQASVSI